MLKIMFAITRRAGDHRCLACPNQGHNHFDTIDQAKKGLKALLSNNLIDTLRSTFGDPELLRVDPVVCYDHGDAIFVFLDEYPLMDVEELTGMISWINTNVAESEQAHQAAGTISQAGMVHRIFEYIQTHNLPKHQWLWADILEAVKRNEIK